METRSRRTGRAVSALFLGAVLLLTAGCYAKMYDDKTIDKEQTAVMRGPVGPGFPMQLTVGDQVKPRKTARIPAGSYTLNIQWIGETKAPPDFMQGHLLRVPYQCSLTYELKAGKKYDVTVIKKKVSLYEYDVTKLTGTRRDGRIVASFEGFYLGCCPEE
jgi:hypothetical protein